MEVFIGCQIDRDDREIVESWISEMEYVIPFYKTLVKKKDYGLRFYE